MMINKIFERKQRVANFGQLAVFVLMCKVVHCFHKKAAYI